MKLPLLRRSLQRVALGVFTLVTLTGPLIPHLSQAATIDWSATAGTTAWATGSNWDGLAVPTNDLNTDIARFDKTSYLNQPTPGTRSVNGIQIGDGTTATAALTITNTALSIGSSGITMFANAGTATLTGGSVKIGANQSWANNSSSLLTISSSITNTGNTTPFTLTLNGSGSGGTTIGGIISNGGTTGTTALSVNTTGGITTLSGVNTYTGGTTLTLGTLKLSGSGTLGGTSGALTVNGGTLDLNGTSQGAGNFTGSGGTIYNNSTGTNVTLTIGNGNGGGGNYSGAIADHTSGTGTIALTKAGTGTLTLSGANTYTGTTTVSAGVLNVRNAAALGTTAGGTTVTAGGALQLQGNITVGAETLTLDGTGVSSDGALRNISGNNSWAGAITINSTTRINSDSGTLTLDVASGSAITGSNDAVQIGGAGNVTINDAIATGSGTLTKDGTGTLTLSAANTYTGTTTVSAGVLNVQNVTGLGTTTGGTSVTSGAALQLQGGIAVGAEALTLNGDGISSDGALRNISGTNAISGATTLGSAASIGVDAGTLTLSGGLANGGFVLTTVGAGDLTLSGTISGSGGGLTLNGTGSVTLSGSAANTATSAATTTVNSGTLLLGKTATPGTTGLDMLGPLVIGDSLGGANSDVVRYLVSNQINGDKNVTVDISNSGLLDLNGFSDSIKGFSLTGGSVTTGTGTLTLTGNVTGNADANTATISGLVAISATRTFTVANGAALIDLSSSAIFSGAGGVTKQGLGTMVMSGASSYTGASSVGAGVFNIQNATALGTTAVGTTVSSGATLQLQGGISVGIEALSIAGPGASGQTGALVNVNGTNNYDGLLTLTAATTLSSDSGTLNLTNAGTITGATFGLTLAGAGNGSLVSIIGTTTGTLSKTGAGTWSVTGANTYTGATTVSAGVLDIQNATGLGTIAGGVTVSSGATLALEGGITVGAETLSIAGTGASGQTGALVNVTGTNNYGGLLTLTAASTLSSDSGTLNLTNAGTITGATFGLTLAGAGNGSISSIIGTTTGALTKTGAGTWTLTGANTYTGGTAINGGPLTVGSSGALGSSGTISFGGGSLQYTASNTTDYSPRFSTAASQAYSIDTNGQNVTLVSALTSSGGSLTKLGTGILTLGNNDTAANTYNGLTTISAGELDLKKAAGTNAIAGDGNTATADLSVAGGTLKWLANNQIADNASINMSSGAVNLNGFTETLYSFTNSGGTFSTGTGHLTGTGATLTWSGGTNTINDGGLVQDGHIVITGGTNTVEGGATGGVLQLDSGGLGLEMTGATLTLNSDNAVAGKLVLNGNVTSYASGTTSQIASGLSNANAGKIDLNGGNRTFTVADGAAVTDLSIGAVITNGSLTKAGTGTMSLSGINTLTGSVTINAGTLTLASGSGGALGSAATVTVNSGTLLLGANDQINDSAAISLGGGTFAKGNFSEGSTSSVGVGALTLTASSHLDFGTGTVGTLRFLSLNASSFILTIDNWTGTYGQQGTGSTDRLIFDSDQSANLSKFQFTGYNPGAVEFALVGGLYEVVAPVPEPGTWGIGSLGLVLIAAHFCRQSARRRKLKPPV